MMVPGLPHAGSRLLPGAGLGVVQGQYWDLWLVLGHWDQYQGFWSILGVFRISHKISSQSQSLSCHQQLLIWSLSHKDVEGHEKTGHGHSHVQAGPNHSSCRWDRVG